MCLLIFILAYFLFILFLSTLIYPMPVNDTGIMRYRTLPWATLTIMVLNILIFLIWLAPDLYGSEEIITLESPEFQRYSGKIHTYGFNEMLVRKGTGVGALSTFTSIFMHADFWHLFGNMIYLWTFGRRVEDACGSARFFLFYLVAGMAANVGSVLFNPTLDTLPGIGASGAISGVMGAYLFLFPGASVNCLWGLGFIVRLPYALVRTFWNQEAKIWRWTVSLPAWLLLIWYVIQNALPSLETIQSDREIAGVNNLAHLTGFFGALTIFLFVRKDLLMRYLSGRSL